MSSACYDQNVSSDPLPLKHFDLKEKRKTEKKNAPPRCQIHKNYQTNMLVSKTYGHSTVSGQVYNLYIDNGKVNNTWHKSQIETFHFRSQICIDMIETFHFRQAAAIFSFLDCPVRQAWP